MVEALHSILHPVHVHAVSEQDASNEVQGEGELNYFLQLSQHSGDAKHNPGICHFGASVLFSGPPSHYVSVVWLVLVTLAWSDVSVNGTFFY